MSTRQIPRWLFVTTAATALITAIAGCGSGGSGDKPVKLSAASDLRDPTSPVTINYVGAAYSAADLAPVLAAFHQAHPMITVNYESIPQANLNSVLSSRFGQKSADFDVFDVDMPRTTAYYARGWLEDLTPAFGNITGKVDAASQAAATEDGKLVAVPLQTSTQLLYYNKKLLAAAHIANPSNAPADRMTWESVAADGKAAQAAGAKYGLVFDQLDAYYQLQPLSESIGGGPGGTGPNKLTPDVDNAAWVKAMTWYGGLYASGESPRGVAAAQTPDLFASGQTAFFAGGPWWAGQFTGEKGLDFGVAAYPTFQGGKAVTPTGAWSIALNKYSKKVVASEIFMKFMGFDDGGFAHLVANLAVPPANTVGAQKFYDAAVFRDPRMAGAVALMKYELTNTATLRLQTVGYLEFEDIMTRTYDDIINGASAPAELKSANDQLTTAWAKYR